MVIYVCEDRRALPALHPCGKALAALDEAGHTVEERTVKGGTLKFWTWPARARDRAEVERVSGQRSVPVLVLDDGEVITGSAAVARWAKEHAPAAAGG